MTAYDMTVVCISADSGVEASARKAGAAAELATACNGHIFLLRTSASFIQWQMRHKVHFTRRLYELVGDLGRRIARLSGDDRERSFFVPTFVCGGAAL